MMRRHLLILIIFIPTISWAQFYVGVKAGYSPLSTITFKPDRKQTPFYGNQPEFGLIVKYFDQKWFGLQAEVNLNQRGYNVPYNKTFSLRQVNNYVEVPFFTHLRFNIAGIYLHVQAGFFAAYLLKAKQGVDTTGTMVLKAYKIDMLRDNRFDYGLVGGGGLSKEFKWGVIQLDIRVLFGYGDLYKHTYNGMPDQSKAVVQNVSVSYLFNLSKLKKKETQEIPQ